MSFMTCLIVLLGGAVGTLARYVVSVLTLPISRELHWGTIIVNVTGSFVIGLFGTLPLAQGRFDRIPPDIELKLPFTHDAG
jgi:CrcB protein